MVHINVRGGDPDLGHCIIVLVVTFSLAMAAFAFGIDSERVHCPYEEHTCVVWDVLTPALSEQCRVERHVLELDLFQEYVLKLPEECDCEACDQEEFFNRTRVPCWLNQDQHDEPPRLEVMCLSEDAKKADLKRIAIILSLVALGVAVLGTLCVYLCTVKCTLVDPSPSRVAASMNLPQMSSYTSSV